MQFTDAAFDRSDPSADARFYAQPRFVEHIDPTAIDDVERLYREWLPAGGELLDLMSSWVSHLPGDVAYRRVVGLGMNARELAANPRLDETIVQDLNLTPELPFPDASFDAAMICVSIQYLTQPVAVLRELGRVVRPGGPAIVSFSNRCFPSKAVHIWRRLRDVEHAALVERFFADAGWTHRATFISPPRRQDPLYAVIAAAPDGSA